MGFLQIGSRGDIQKSSLGCLAACKVAPPVDPVRGGLYTVGATLTHRG